MAMSAGYQGLDPDEMKKLKSSHQTEDYHSLISHKISEHDQLLINTIQQKLLNHTEILNPHIGIHVQDGLVTVYGRIASMEEKATIEALIINVNGVRDVINQLKLEDERAVEKNLSGHANLSLPRKDL